MIFVITAQRARPVRRAKGRRKPEAMTVPETKTAFLKAECLSLAEARAREVFPGWRIRVRARLLRSHLETLTPEQLIKVLS